MSSVICIPDVTVQALEDLLSQFDESPNVQALVALLTRAFQSLEDDACTLIFDALLSNATGALLDRYGVVLDVPRGGRTDDAYRALLQVTITARDTSGTIESILSVISTLAGGAVVEYALIPPAGFNVGIFFASPPAAETIADIIASLFELAPAGVQFTASHIPPDPFAFAGPDGLGFDSGAFAGPLA